MWLKDCEDMGRTDGINSRSIWLINVLTFVFICIIIFVMIATTIYTDPYISLSLLTFIWSSNVILIFVAFHKLKPMCYTKCIHITVEFVHRLVFSIYLLKQIYSFGNCHLVIGFSDLILLSGPLVVLLFLFSKVFFQGFSRENFREPGTSTHGKISQLNKRERLVRSSHIDCTSFHVSFCVLNCYTQYSI